MTQTIDDVPHTGGMGYQDSIPRVPGAAISTLDAEMLSAALREGTGARPSHPVVHDSPRRRVGQRHGELTGTERPAEVIVVGGHLDSWDKGTGATTAVQDAFRPSKPSGC